MGHDQHSQRHDTLFPPSCNVEPDCPRLGTVGWTSRADDGSVSQVWSCWEHLPPVTRAV